MSNSLSIQEVALTDTPNHGRLVWNANDRWLASRLNAVAELVAALPRQEHLSAVNAKASPYQAQGDGQHNDQPALQAALDDREQAGGGCLFLPAGTYRLDAPLLLRNGVHLVGAGMSSTTLKLGAEVNQPVLTDASAGKAQAYAFGRVYLADFAIDGNKTQNAAGQEGIFTTAYFSTFERLGISNCGTHGIRFGFPEMGNASSQNRVVGCRIGACAGAGINIDINGIDHTVTENYIYGCTYGIVIQNGGVRVINNDIFGNAKAGLLVRQTANGLIVAANDFNANKQHGIHITRTTHTESGPWSQILVTANSILGDGLEEDNRYDGIHVETAVAAGIVNLSVTGNKIFSLARNKQYRNGIHLAQHVTATHCAANHIYNVATAPYFVGDTCSAITIDRLGGMVLPPPPLPPSGVALTNPFHSGVTIYLSGGLVQSIATGDTTTGITAGTIRLPAGQTITLHYAEAPTWQWVGD